LGGLSFAGSFITGGGWGWLSTLLSGSDVWSANSSSFFSSSAILALSLPPQPINPLVISTVTVSFVRYLNGTAPIKTMLMVVTSYNENNKEQVVNVTPCRRAETLGAGVSAAIVDPRD
jgi:hypothetical protein